MGNLKQNRTDIVRLWLAAFLVSGLLFAGTAQPVQAVPIAYYVATTGSDSNAGTSLGTPFRTIQKCASVARAGDTCFIRGGVYRETVTPAWSGTSSAPITFKSYNSEAVTVNGADVVSGWTPYSGHIHRAPMAWNLNARTPSQITDNQVFVDGQMMVEARWPNIVPERVTSQRTSDQARADGASGIGQNAGTYQDAALSAVPGGLFNGGKINFGPGTNIVHTTCNVTSQTGSAVAFQCDPDPAAWNARSDLTSSGDMLRPQGGNYYYLWGKLAALDTAGEWFRDSGGTLYLWLPDGGAPSGHVVEARKRLWAFDLSGRDYIVVDGLHLFAAGIKYDTATDHTTVQNAWIEYPWHFQELPVLHYLNGTPGLRLLGGDNTIRDSTLAYSAGSMINLDGLRGRAANNVVFNAGYMAVGAALSGATDAGSLNPGGSSSNVATQNTVFDVGRLGIAADPGLNITYNDLYASHLQTTDLGTVYAFGTDGKGAQIAYNLVHDNRAEYNQSLKYWGGHGIYLDDETYNYKVYRNITWNTTAPGIFAFGTQSAPSNRLFYHNTVDGTLSASPKSGQTMSGTEFKNNIGDTVAVSGAGLVVASNYAGDALFVDRATRDYQLRHYSPAVDAGQTLGSPYQDAPMAPVGVPDIGALERGRVPFLAGALIRSLDLAALSVRCSAQADGATASCQVSRMALGRRLPGNFELAIGNTTRPARTCVTKMNYVTHLALATCQGVPIGGLGGVQPVYVRIDSGSWVTPDGQADLRDMAVQKVTPGSGITRGGVRVTLSGRRFDIARAGWEATVTVNNPSSVPQSNYQVLVPMDTARLIAQGKLRPDCADAGFYDPYGEQSFWLEDGCSTTATRFWVKVAYLPPGASTITFAYGHGGQTKTSNGRATFVFFDDFEDGAVSQYWTPGQGDFYTAREIDGQMVLAGATDGSNQYEGAVFLLNGWLIPYPANFAIDSDLSVLTGANNFKASLGTGGAVLAIQGQPTGSPPGKNLAYYNGSSWVPVGKSTVNSATFSGQKFSVTFSGPATSRTVRWLENGNLTGVLAARSGQNNPQSGLFLYGADAVTAFDARFDDVRVRNYTYPEPSAAVGAERASGARITFGGLPCTNIVVTDPTTAQCSIPPHAAGPVDVVVINPNGQQATLVGGFTYVKGWSSFLPLIVR